MPRSKKTQQAIDEALRIDPDKPPVGLGVDIVEIDRIRKILKRSPAFKNIFSENERKYCDSMTDPAPHYACRFAAKEAVVKALGCGFEEGVWLHDIEVKRTSKGRPYVAITGKLRQVAREMDINDIPISLSYTHSEAIACAMAITSASEPEQKRPDPKEELSEQFKKTRAILDDL